MRIFFRADLILFNNNILYNILTAKYYTIYVEFEYDLNPDNNNIVVCNTDRKKNNLHVNNCADNNNNKSLKNPVIIITLYRYSYRQ